MSVLTAQGTRAEFNILKASAPVVSLRVSMETSRVQRKALRQQKLHLHCTIRLCPVINAINLPSTTRNKSRFIKSYRNSSIQSRSTLFYLQLSKHLSLMKFQFASPFASTRQRRRRDLTAKNKKQKFECEWRDEGEGKGKAKLENPSISRHYNISPSFVRIPASA